MATRQRVRFSGEICGFGTSSGHRFVIGRWPDSPFGAFADVMHEAPDGVRTLFAPDDEVAEFVRGTYTFDAAQIGAIATNRNPGELHLDAGMLVATISIGTRTGLGRLLHTVPARLATAPAWCTAIDPIARVVMRGVRTRGTAGQARSEWYGATDQHRVTAIVATLDNVDLGTLADVWPPVRFGFSSTPRTPGIVAVTTTIASRQPLLRR